MGTEETNDMARREAGGLGTRGTTAGETPRDETAVEDIGPAHTRPVDESSAVGTRADPATRPDASPVPDSSGPSRHRPLGLAVAAGLSLALVVAAQIWQLGQPPLPGHMEATPVTGFVAGILEWLALLAAVGTLGSLLTVALGYRHPGRGAKWRLSPSHYDVLGSAARWALTWGLASLTLVVFNAADSNGVPLAYVLNDLGSTLVSTQSAQAWLATAVVALAIALGCWLGRTWRLVVGMVVLAVLATLPTVVTAQVSVGTDHDLATDAAIMFTLATVWWFGATWAAVRSENAAQPDADRGAADEAPDTATAQVVLRRARWAGVVGVIVAIPTRVGIGLFEQAGQAPWHSAYGFAIVALLLVLAVLGVRVGMRRPGRAKVAGTSAKPSMAGDLALVLVVVGLQAAMWRIHPHRYLAPQTAAQNFLGYNVGAPPPLAEFFLPGRPNLLLTVTALAAIGLYLWGMRRVVRAGHHWPIGRLVGWLVGWVMILILLDSKMWAYSSATFGWHMVVHMTVNMGAPVLMVLGAPITLLFRAGRASRPGEPASVRDAVNHFMDWRLIQTLLNPLLIWVIFIGSLYLLYLTPLFGSAMRYHWAHQLMIVHFIVIGYLFNWLVIGADRAAKPLPYVARLGYVFAAMPFHAFFAVALLVGSALTGANFFRSLNLRWLHDLARQQQIGGQITWATSEVPLFVLIIVLVWQWFRQDQREARRKDRALDSGRDDSLEAYNQMLASLAQRDRRSPGAQEPGEDTDQDRSRRPVHDRGSDHHDQLD